MSEDKTASVDETVREIDGQKKPICIIPVYCSKDEHLAVLQKCLHSIRNPETTDADVDILMVDDCSPHENVKTALPLLATKYNADIIWKSENTGFSKTVNKGLQICLDEQRVGILVNLDIEFIKKDWLKAALEDPADIVGARLLYANGLLQHAGVMYSPFYGHWDHRFKYGAFNMPEAMIRTECPVTGALQIIKPSALNKIGLYDEGFSLAYEDVDYCLRADQAGLTVAYNPRVLAYHLESLVRGGAATEKTQRWYMESWNYLQQKHAGLNVTRYVMPIDRRRNTGEGVPGPQQKAS